MKQCLICLGEINPSDLVLECPHCARVFHEAHLRAWVKLKAECPICRKRIAEGSLPPVEIPSEVKVIVGVCTEEWADSPPLKKPSQEIKSVWDWTENKESEWDLSQAGTPNDTSNDVDVDGSANDVADSDYATTIHLPERISQHNDAESAWVEETQEEIKRLNDKDKQPLGYSLKLTKGRRKRFPRDSSPRDNNNVANVVLLIFIVMIATDILFKQLSGVLFSMQFTTFAFGIMGISNENPMFSIWAMFGIWGFYLIMAGIFGGLQAKARVKRWVR